MNWQREELHNLSTSAGPLIHDFPLWLLLVLLGGDRDSKLVVGVAGEVDGLTAAVAEPELLEAEALSLFGQEDCQQKTEFGSRNARLSTHPEKACLPNFVILD